MTSPVSWETKLSGGPVPAEILYPEESAGKKKKKKKKQTQQAKAKPSAEFALYLVPTLCLNEAWECFNLIEELEDKMELI